MEQPLDHLLQCLELTLGHKPRTPRDFTRLSQLVSSSTHEAISASTLKRLYGYDKAEGKPYTATLDILARFLLYADYADFLSHEPASGGGNSSSQERLIAATPILSDQLSPGQLLQLWWRPNSHCVIRHEGQSRFTVVEAEDTRLLAGDTFLCPAFIPHEPLYLYSLSHQGRHNLLYVIGTHDGIMPHPTNISPHVAT